MKSLKEKFQDYKKNKSVWGKITDIIFILFILALFIPDSRLAIGGLANRVKSMIMEPTVTDTNNEQLLTINDLDWQLENLPGKSINLKDHQGKVIFLNIWATWCPPCVGEMPGIQNLYEKFKDNNNISFFLVSDENPDKVKSFIQKKGYTFPVYTTKYRSPQIFLTQSIPTTFVISKKGAIVIKEKGALNWGGEKMEKIINDLLNE